MLLLIFLACLAVIPTLLIFVILLMWSIKKCVVVLAKATNQGFIKDIPSCNAVYINDDFHTRPLCTITITKKVSGPPEKVHEFLVNRLTEIYSSDEGQKYYSELGFYPVSFCRFGFFKKVENFNISERVHLRTDVTVSENKFEAEMASLVESVLEKPYLRNTPPWDIFIHHTDNGQTVVVNRFHHVIGDGFSLIKLLHDVVGQEYKPIKSSKKPNPPRKTCLDHLKSILGEPLLSLRAFVSALTWKDRHPIQYDGTQEKFRMQGTYKVALSKKMDLDELKANGTLVKASLNEFFTLSINQAIEQYIEKYFGREHIPPECRFLTILPLPDHPKGLVNHWTMAHVKVPLSRMSLENKAAYHSNEILRACNSVQPAIMAFLLKHVMGKLPKDMTNVFTANPGTHTSVVTNVPGPTEDLFMGDYRITDCFFSTSCAATSFIIGLFSYGNSVRISISSDDGCVPDRKMLEDFLSMITAVLERKQ